MDLRTGATTYNNTSKRSLTPCDPDDEPPRDLEQEFATAESYIADYLKQPLALYVAHASRLAGVNPADIGALVDGDRVGAHMTLEEAGLRDPESVCELSLRGRQVGGAGDGGDGWTSPGGPRSRSMSPCDPRHPQNRPPSAHAAASSSSAAQDEADAPPDEPNCSICMATIQNAAKLDGCPHSFCNNCITPWCKRSPTCPECRESISTITTDSGTVPAPAREADVEDGSTSEEERLRQLRADRLSARQAQLADECAKLNTMEVELSKMVGLERPKELVREIVKGKIAEKHGVRQPSGNHNIILLGNSGLGKSEFVRVLFSTLKNLGILTGELIEATSKDLQKDVAGHYQSAVDGMLFIDEAYSLKNSTATTTALVRLIPKDHGDVMVVVTGYHKEMKEWLVLNQGFNKRFNHIMLIENYTKEELMKIAEIFLQKMGAELKDDEAIEKLRLAAEYIVSLGPDSGNADYIKMVLDKAHTLVTARWVDTLHASGRRPSRSVILTADDIAKGQEDLAERIRLIGHTGPTTAQLRLGDGGAGGSGTLSPEAKATVVAELKSLVKPTENSVVTLRTKAPSLVHTLSDSSLLLLGASNVAQVRDFKNGSARWLASFLANLKACIEEAFPGCDIKENETNRTTKGRKFKGDYLDDMGYVQ